MRVIDVTFNESVMYDRERHRIGVELPIPVFDSPPAAAQDDSDTESDTSVWSSIVVVRRNNAQTAPVTTTQERGLEEEITQRESESQNQSLMTPRATPEDDPPLYNTVQQPRSVRNIGLDLDEANILTERRVRRPQRHAYAVRRQEIHKTQLDNVDNASIYHMAFSAAATFMKARIHSTELPAPPNHWRDMLSHPHKAGFLAAAEKEFKDLESAGTFKPTSTSRIGTARPIPVRWVFTYKFDEDDYLNKYKARLVVRGDMQRDSLFEETYAGTLAASVFRFLMAIACYFDLEIKQFDAKNAFSQAFLDELIYIHYPEGFGRHGHVLRLIKALYGLRRSPLLWFNEISKALSKLGFQCIGDARCLFIKKGLIVFFYVDDICVVFHRHDAEIYEQFKTRLMATFVLRELGDVKWFLAALGKLVLIFELGVHLGDTSTDSRQQCNNSDVAAGLRRALCRVRHSDLFSNSQAVE
jgi:hypothetical protein